MLTWEVDEALLAPHVPPGTSLDAFRGRALLSVVAFRFLDTRVLGVPVPGHRDFPEVNLRFYVARDAPDGRRRGVVFVREVVPHHAVAWVARAVFSERYVAVPMEEDVVVPDPPAPGRAAYSLEVGDHCVTVAADIVGPAVPPGAGTEEEFVAEHYWGYARGRRGTLEYEVEHPPWQVRHVAAATLDAEPEALVSLYGEGFARALAREPDSAFYAAGSEVVVHVAGRLAPSS